MKKMNNIYDNGELLLGKKQDILKYQTMLINENLIDKEDYEEITEYLQELEDDTIVCINYDNGMGITFDIWDKSDIVKIYGDTIIKSI